MTNDGYKWRLVTRLEHDAGRSCFLLLLPRSGHIDPDYIHKPGDIDYSVIQHLSDTEKHKILYYVATGHVKEDIAEDMALVAIAGMITVDRQTNPNFVPEELNPDF